MGPVATEEGLAASGTLVGASLSTQMLQNEHWPPPSLPMASRSAASSTGQVEILDRTSQTGSCALGR